MRPDSRLDTWHQSRRIAYTRMLAQDLVDQVLEALGANTPALAFELGYEDYWRGVDSPESVRKSLRDDYRRGQDTAHGDQLDRDMYADDEREAWAWYNGDKTRKCVVVYTQYMENYAFDMGGKPHWKFKGGGEYIIRNVPADCDISEVLRMFEDRMVWDNELSRQYIRYVDVERHGFEAPKYWVEFEWPPEALY